jgi:hypothetical protein
MSNEPENNEISPELAAKRRKVIGIWTAMGIIVGVVFGFSQDNYGLGIALGLAIGTAVGVTRSKSITK